MILKKAKFYIKLNFICYSIFILISLFLFLVSNSILNNPDSLASNALLLDVDLAVAQNRIYSAYVYSIFLGTLYACLACSQIFFFTFVENNLHRIKLIFAVNLLCLFGVIAFFIFALIPLVISLFGLKAIKNATLKENGV